MSRFSFFILIALALAASYTPVVNWPLGWVETFFHEISHGLAALATGGGVDRIELHLRGSGLCYTMGGSRFVVSFSGYAGAVLWGALLYLAAGAANPRLANSIVALLGVLVVSVGLLWVRDLISFLILAVILGIVIVAYAAGRYNLSRLIIRFIALYVMLSAAQTPLVLVDGRDIGDGYALATHTGVPELFWVIVWEAIALAALWLVYRSHRGDSAPNAETETTVAVEARFR